MVGMKQKRFRRARGGKTVCWRVLGGIMALETTRQCRRVEDEREESGVRRESYGEAQEEN